MKQNDSTELFGNALVNVYDKHPPDPTTRAPQVPSSPPRGWSGAGVGVGMLRGGGDSKFIQEFEIY